MSLLYNNDHSANMPSVTVALLPWGNVLEDFLDTIGVSFETFCQEFTGSYMFGYVEALRRAGVHTVLIIVSSSVVAPSYFTHAPTGATICAVPPAMPYRMLRRWIRNPYGRNVQRVFGTIRGTRRLLIPALWILRELLPYLATPVWSVARVLQRTGCVAVLCQEYEYARFDVCVLLGRLLRLPIFATFQGGDEQWSRLERFVRPHTIRASTGLIIATQREAERVQAQYSVPAAKLAHIFNPLNLTLWEAIDRHEARKVIGIPPDARVAIWHGRVSIRRKGLDVLIEAWQQVCRERAGRDLRLLLIGNGEDAAAFRKRLETLQLPGVTWVNEFVHDRALLRYYLSAADVFAFSSRHEGFPVAPLEAMACGLPVVGADAHGIPDILEGGEASGGIVVPRSNPAAFAAALGHLLDDVAWSRELGERARHRVESSFSLEAVGEQLRLFLLQNWQHTSAQTVQEK